MKKIIYWSIIASLVLSLAPAITFAQDEEPTEPEEEEVPACATSEVATCDPDNMLHMVLRVRWGNVLDLPEDKEETNFDGSISLSSDEGHISLIRKLLFESHNSDRDKITSKIDPVSWQSLIYGHWDGVSVLVSGKASDTVTIQTTQGSIVRTIEQLYETHAPIIEDVGEGREIVVKVLPYKKRTFLLQLLWGGGIKGQKVDFTGSAVINSGAEGKRYKTVRFEPEQGDQITSVSKTSVYWNSYIYGGYDGILARIVADKDIDNEDTITVKFASDEVNWSQSFSILEIYHNRITKVEIPVSIIKNSCEGSTSGDETTKCLTDKPYTLRLAVKRHPNRKLIKVKGKPAVYIIEDDTKRPILSAGVFEANNLDWSEIEEVDQEELDTYADGENLNYPDGTLIKGSGPAVYVVSNGQKRPFINAKAFLKLGYQWKKIKRIRDAEVADYEIGPAITEDSDYPDGSLVREEGTAGIYLIEGGQRKPIPSADVFLSNGYKWGQVLVVPKVQKNLLTKYKLGKKVSYPDGTLIKGSKSTVYVIDKGKKRPIKSADDFVSNNYRWNKIKVVSDADVNDYDTGNEVIGGDA